MGRTLLLTDPARGMPGFMPVFLPMPFASIACHGDRFTVLSLKARHSTGPIFHFCRIRGVIPAQIFWGPASYWSTVCPAFPYSPDWQSRWGLIPEFRFRLGCPCGHYPSSLLPAYAC